MSFEECEAVKSARERVQRLAKSKIPLYVGGEPGTGRRTLARAAARCVPGATEVVEVSEIHFDPGLLVAPPRRTRVVIAEFPELLDARRQVALSIAADSHTVQLVAWGAEAGGGRLDPELRYLLEPGWVVLPPLRARGRDVLKWAVLFLHRANGSSVPSLSAQAEEALLCGAWPGNLRQLDAALRRVVLRREAGDRSPITAEELTEPVLDDSPSLLPLADAVERFRQSYMLDTLARFDGDRARAAAVLDVDPGSLAPLAPGRKLGPT